MSADGDGIGGTGGGPGPVEAGAAQDRNVVDIENLLSTGRYAEARRRATALTVAEPGDADALSLLARAVLGEGDPAAAVAVADRAVAADPSSEYAHRIRAIVLQAAGRFEESAAAAREATRLEPFSWPAWVQLAMSGSDVPAARTEAWEAGRQAVHLAPYESASHLAMGVAAMDLDAATARRAFAEALRLNPGDAQAINNLALLDGRAGNIRAAADGFARAASADPTEEIPRRNLRIALVAMLMYGHVGVWVVFVVFARVARNLSEGSPVPRVLGLVFTAIVAVAVVLGVRQYRRMPVGLRRYALTLLRRDLVFGGWSAALVVAVVLLGAGLLGPAGWRHELVNAGLVPMLVGVGLFLVARWRLKRGRF